MLRLPTRLSITPNTSKPLITQVRHQSSSKTSAANLNTLIKENQAIKKSLKPKGKESEYNALSNANILKNKNENSSLIAHPPQAKEIKKLNYDSIPKVAPQTTLDPTLINIDCFYAGFKPLHLEKLKSSLIPSNSSRLLNGYESCWSYSATGMESFPEWYHLDAATVSKCKPFSPPLTAEQEMKLRAKDSEIFGESRKFRTTKRSKTKGRTKPLAVLLGRKKF